jgi:hypothetical protein
MRMVFKQFVATGIAALTVCALTSVAAAQSTADHSQGVKVAASELDSAAAAALQENMINFPAEFGTEDSTILQIPASAFRPRKRAATLEHNSSEGTIWPGEATSVGYDYWAPVYLPEGVLVQYLNLYGCDSNAGNHVMAALTGYNGPANGSTTLGIFDFGFVSSTQVAGATPCGYWIKSFSPELQINNNVRYNNGYHYVINVKMEATDGTNRFKGVDIWYKRQVSPAPVVASFTDVPTTHPFFREIEALAASGVSTGYADGTFRPSDPVTRQAMAAFLARALGLHFPQ